ncbi:MAG: bacteriohemerythrin [Spirochaetota bacterium]
MSMFKWNEKYLTGIDLIDEQHKEMVNIFNKLYKAYYESDKNQVTNTFLKKIFYELIDYMYIHFTTEENLLYRFNYPYFSEHKALHDEFKRELTKMYDEFRYSSEYENKIVVTSHLILYIYEWVEGHILKSDKKYSDYIREYGISMDKVKDFNPFNNE